MKKLFLILVSVFVILISAFGQNSLTSSAVNLRAYSSSESRVILVIPQGSQVRVLNTLLNGWSQVFYNNQTGYVYSYYLIKGSYYSEASRSKTRYYTNSAGQRVQSPTYYPSVPAGATARCVDGTYSFSKNRRGTCSHHGGVSQWLY